MKRKVNLVGQNTLTISLPSKWIKQHNIKKGDQLEVIEEKNVLKIKQQHKKEEKKCTLDVTGQKTMTYRIVAAAYKAGYDELTVKYNNTNELEEINRRIEKNLAENDVVEFKKKEITFRSGSQLNPKKFNDMFRRIFFSVNSMAKDVETALKEKSFEELKSTKMKDGAVGKYTDYCRRLLNKGLETDFKSPYSIYYIIEEIEIIADFYKHMALSIIKRRKIPHKEIIQLLEEVNIFLKSFIDLLFAFDMQKINKFGTRKEIIEKKIQKMYKTVKKEDLETFTYTIQIFNNTFEMKGALLTNFI